MFENQFFLSQAMLVSIGDALNAVLYTVHWHVSLTYIQTLDIEPASCYLQKTLTANFTISKYCSIIISRVAIQSIQCKRVLFGVVSGVSRGMGILDGGGEGQGAVLGQMWGIPL